MVSAPREREGAPSPWDAPLGHCRPAQGPISLQAADSLLGCGPPLSSLGASKQRGLLGRPLGTPECPQGPRATRGRLESHPRATHPRAGNLEDGEKEGKLLLALRKVHRGCQALCVLNLGCECAQFSLGACGYADALLWADLCESLCASGSVRGREATRSTSVVLAALLVPAQGALAWHQLQGSFWLASFTALVNNQSILSKRGCDAGEGTSRQWFNLNLNVPNYRFCLMLYFLPKDLDGNQRIERKISCHLQDRLSLSLHSQEIVIPNLSELVLFLC